MAVLRMYWNSVGNGTLWGMAPRENPVFAGPAHFRAASFSPQAHIFSPLTHYNAWDTYNLHLAEALTDPTLPIPKPDTIQYHF
jgi:hypothetical protein